MKLTQPTWREAHARARWIGLSLAAVASLGAAPEALAQVPAPDAAPAPATAPAPNAAPVPDAAPDPAPAPDAASAPERPAAAPAATPAPDAPAPSVAATKQLTLDELGVSGPDAGLYDEVDPNIHIGPRSAANFFWPFVDALGINIALWSVPYAMGSPFAKINPTYWKNNLKSGFQWDDNEIEVNQFFHPYQGGLYFTAARVNGLTFWESVPYAMFGAWQWEYFMETEQASTNDWMATTWGGFFFGEALYRLSNRILDDSASGSSRFFKEFGAMAISPINGLDRVATGQAWAEGPRHKPAPLKVDFRLGFDGVGLSEGEGWGTTFRTSIRFDYGELYEKEQITTPFEAFDLAFEVSASDKSFGEGVDGTGVLMGRRFSFPNNDNLIAWVLDYQYFTNATQKAFKREAEGTYQLGEIGTGPSWFAHWNLGRGFSIDSELDALAVPTGAVTSPYAVYEVNRSYNYGAGGTFKAEVNLRQQRWGRLYAMVDRYLYYVVNGATGVENVGLLKLGAYANLYKGHGVGFAAIYYNRSSYYEDYPDVFDSFWSEQFHYEVEW